MQDELFIEIEQLYDSSAELDADAACPCGGGMLCCCCCIPIDQEPV